MWIIRMWEIHTQRCGEDRQVTPHICGDFRGDVSPCRQGINGIEKRAFALSHRAGISLGGMRTISTKCGRDRCSNWFKPDKFSPDNTLYPQFFATYPQPGRCGEIKVGDGHCQRGLCQGQVSVVFRGHRQSLALRALVEGQRWWGGAAGLLVRRGGERLSELGHDGAG